MMMIGALFPTFFADRYGRRTPMILGCAGMGLSMMMVSICLSFRDSPSIGPQMSKAAVAFFFAVSFDAKWPQDMITVANLPQKFMLIFGMSIDCLTW